MEISKKKIIIFLIHLLLFTCLVFNLLYFFYNNYCPENWSVYVSIIALVILIIQIITLKKIDIDICDFTFWYILLQFIFYYGRIILYAVGLDERVPWKLFLMYPEIIIFKASLFVLCYSQGFFVGVTLIRSNQYQSLKKEKSKTIKYSSNTLFYTGMFMFCFTFIFELYNNIQTIMAQKAGQYIAVIEISGIYAALGKVAISGIIVMIASKRLSLKKVLGFVSIYITYEIIYMMLSGDRRQAITSFIVIGLCILKVYKLKINMRNIVLICILSYIMLSLMAAIKIVRQDGITISSVLSNFIDILTSGNLFVEVMGEFGGTFFTIVNSVAYYPSQYDFIAGRTYLASLLIIIPGIFTHIFPDMFNKVTIPENLQSIDGNPCGGSLAQDLYANFGVLGVLGTVILGILIAIITRKYKNSTAVDNCRYYIIFLVLINLVRAGIYEISRALAFSLILFEIGCIIVNSKNIKYNKLNLRRRW